MPLTPMPFTIKYLNVSEQIQSFYRLQISAVRKLIETFLVKESLINGKNESNDGSDQHTVITPTGR